MFVCYQTSIERQFEYIQRSRATIPDFVCGKVRPGSDAPVTPGFDPIIGQAPGQRRARNGRTLSELSGGQPADDAPDAQTIRRC